MRRLFLVWVVLPVGAAQTYFMETANDTTSTLERCLALTSWCFFRPLYVLLFTIAVPREER